MLDRDHENLIGVIHPYLLVNKCLFYFHCKIVMLFRLLSRSDIKSEVSFCFSSLWAILTFNKNPVCRKFLDPLKYTDSV